MAGPPKICILFPFRDGPWGGSNQLLRALRDVFRARGRWVEAPDAADVVLFDSFSGAANVIAWKRRLPATPFVHRIDGPISLYRGGDRYVDDLIHALSEKMADGVIFQSRYSHRENLRLGMAEPRLRTVILNAPDGAVFNGKDRKPAPDGRLRIVASSWSPNWNKGFDVYRHLDETLDFSRYSLTFVGNSPIAFRNIRHLPPQDPAGVASILRDADIYLTASRKDPCSNALAEAIACGLVPVARRSGGHPELAADGGVLFDGIDDVMAAIETAAANLAALRAVLPERSARRVAEAYAGFLEQVWREAGPAKRLSAALAFGLRLRLLDARMRGNVQGLAARVRRVTGRPAARQETGDTA